MNTNKLKNIYLFKGLTSSDIKNILPYFKVLEFAPKSKIFNEGDTENSLYIILEGKIKISKVIEENKRETLIILGEKEFFGEMSLIDEMPRSADAISIINSTILKINKTSFRNLLKKERQISISLLQNLLTIASKHLRNSNDRFSSITKRGYGVIEEMENVKSDMISLVSHELRTPLTIIKGFTELLLSNNLNIESTERFLKKISHQANKLTRTVDNLISLSIMQYKKMEFFKENTDIKSLFNAALKEIENAAVDKNIKIKLIIPKKSILVNIDSKAYSTVLYNLLENAVKFTAKNGSIILKIEIGSKIKSKQTMLVSISDNGVGISKDKINTIFDPFSQEEHHKTRQFEGAGIGLPVVKNIITAHGGEIWVESEVNKGSEFIFTLPLD